MSSWNRYTTKRPKDQNEEVTMQKHIKIQFFKLQLSHRDEKKEETTVSMTKNVNRFLFTL